MKKKFEQKIIKIDDNAIQIYGIGTDTSIG